MEAKDNRDYEICSDEMWEYLNSRYGSDLEVRRYYKQSNQYSYYSSLEVSMKNVPVCLIFTDQLATINVVEESFAMKYVQVRKTATYGDLKKRIADCASNMLN